jgi:hypothetical protein
MADISLNKNSKGVIELSFDDWLKIWGSDRARNNEKVVALDKLNEDNAVVLPKKQWTRGFKGLSGLMPANYGKNELLPGGDAGRAIQLTDHIVTNLGIRQKDTVCITEAHGRYFAKSFVCEKLISEIPGWIVMDEFHETQVVRWWASNPSMDAISTEVLERMLDSAGKLRFDPIATVAKMGDGSILPAKRELLGNLNSTDEEELSAYVTKLCESQLSNGSWEDSAVITAGNIIRLLQSGIDVSDMAIQRGIVWLEQSEEPMGMPGLFFYGEDKGREYNQRKSEGKYPLDIDTARNASTRQRNFFNKLSEEYFGQFLDLVPKSKACEPHTTWATALALQALLRCGKWDSPRVKRAIKTLMQWRSHSKDCGGWCGCGIFGGMLAERGIDPDEQVDFDSAKIPKSNRDLEFATWFMTKAAVRSMVCNPYAENFTCLKLTDNMGLLVKNRMSSPSSNCTTVIQSALSRHPDYQGSKLEHLFAYEMSGMQNPNGDWPSHRISGMLHFVSLIDHPLSRFLAYRSLPALIRRQKENGLWFSEENNESVDDFLVLSALTRLGILENLLPVEEL